MRTRQKWMGILGVLAVLLLASAGLGHAWGGGHGFHHGFHGGFHRFGGPRIGIGIGIGPLWAPYWGAYPYYSYPPVVVAPPPVVVHPSPQLSIQSAPAPFSWYDCDHAGGYYPYVQQCPGGWRAVAPTPP
jgi:hypothetical protein